ncbi:hypothetical protein FJK98_02455 [Micromonospora sp. HM134]|uniref:DUF6093 family protein n=1 Tax=Micromonospora sp. HM134 TaxID=2583243 RepID=UPI00119854A7|nr:DUF6093 family protein [Micromonospora sp. HM134]QDY06163.1 hypothetical protein FJK98_02455 [Micromonospora sp. HM134]
MSVESALRAGRRAAERLMVDRCTIRRTTGVSTNPETGQTAPTDATIYQGRCRVQQSAVQSREESPGQAELLMVPRELHLPVATSGGVRVDDEVVIDACTYDPDLVGRHLTVRGESAKSLATARRLHIEEAAS